MQCAAQVENIVKKFNITQLYQYIKIKKKNLVSAIRRTILQVTKCRVFKTFWVIDVKIFR